MLLIIDNYDSFTYNLVGQLKMLERQVEVLYNDDSRLETDDLNFYEGILISPGPKSPSEAGYIKQVIEQYYDKVPILGICLGHQAIGEVFGEKVVRAKQLMHGKGDAIHHDSHPLFNGVEDGFNGVRYHSLVIEKPLKNNSLEVIARSKSDDEIMGVKHSHYPVFGLQFHPESYETQGGIQMIANFLDAVDAHHISKAEVAKELANQLLNEKINGKEAVEVLLGLNQKGIDFTDMAGFSQSLIENAIVKTQNNGQYTDTCGTGGDQLNTFNISTTCAFVLAAAGLKVAKHGNRSISSKCGSADVLEALGVNLNSPVNQVEDIIASCHLAFLFAQNVHPKMKAVMPIRKQIKGPTIFNVIGPLSNPLPLENQMIGVYDESLLIPMLKCMKINGVRRPIAVHGYGGMDEFSLEGDNQMVFYRDNQIVESTINGQSYGFPMIKNTRLVGGDARTNAHLLREILMGIESDYSQIVVFNAGIALYHFLELDTLEEGFELARYQLKSGGALEVLNQLILNSSEVKQ